LDIKTNKPDSIKSRLSIESDYNNNITFTYNNSEKVWEINLAGQSHESVGRITAYYKQDNGSKVAVGFLDLAGYNKQTIKLVIVPVGKAYTIDKDALTDTINSIYKQAITYWDVSVLPTINPDFEENDKTGLDTDLPGIAAYTKEMNNLNDAIKDRSDYNKDTYYLFLIDKSESGDKNGIMPFRRHFGYIFMNDQEKLADNKPKMYHTMGHELGHGAFCLQHPWTEKGTTEGQTYSIMDYKRDAPNTQLYHYQWDEVHDPKISLFGGSEEEVSDIESCDAPYPKYDGKQEGQHEITYGQRIDSNPEILSATISSCSQTWVWHFNRKELPSFERDVNNKGKWFKIHEYCKIKHVQYVAAAIYVLTDLNQKKYQDYKIESDKYMISTFFYSGDNPNHLLSAAENCSEEIKKIMSYQEIATGRVEEENIVFDILTFVTPGMIYKGGKAILRGILSLANTERVILSLKSISSGALILTQLNGAAIKVSEASADDIIKYTITEGKELGIVSNGRKIATLTDGILNPIKFSDETGTVVSRVVTSTYDDAGKETIEVLELVNTQKGLIFRKTVSSNAPFRIDALTNIANDPNNIQTFVANNIDELLKAGNIEVIWSLGGGPRGRLIESIMFINKYQKAGYQFIGAWNYKAIDFVDGTIIRGTNQITEVVSFKTFTTAKTGQEALNAFEQTLKKSAKALNEATLANQYSGANKVLDIVVRKGKFDMDKLNYIWNLIKGSYPNVKNVNISSF